MNPAAGIGHVLHEVPQQNTHWRNAQRQPLEDLKVWLFASNFNRENTQADCMTQGRLGSWEYLGSRIDVYSRFAPPGKFTWNPEKEP